MLIVLSQLSIHSRLLPGLLLCCSLLLVQPEAPVHVLSLAPPELCQPCLLQPGLLRCDMVCIPPLCRCSLLGPLLHE